MSRIWRAYAPQLSGEPGAIVVLDEVEAHHVHRVLRLRVGEPLAVFDGRGTEWEATLVTCRPGDVRLRLERERTEPVESPIGIRLFQGLCRSEKMEWVVQKATELGVRAVFSFPAERSDARVPARARVERWQRVAIEACKQSGRRSIPLVESIDVLPVPDVPDVLALLLDPSAGAETLDGTCSGRTPGEVWIAAGPEAGFSEREVKDGAAAGWNPVSLGPRVLRAETAGIVAAAIVLHRWGDLGKRQAG